ncbi:unnamed protein product [Adineta steineri]|uniref:Uncharacterized protein n=1 Tax=Adineta steineri TaxID=433720 RepID=A0A815NX54_9BILA|nr:unnamed protein product [Adineta steineri]
MEFEHYRVILFGGYGVLLLFEICFFMSLPNRLLARLVEKLFGIIRLDHQRLIMNFFGINIDFLSSRRFRLSLIIQLAFIPWITLVLLVDGCIFQLQHLSGQDFCPLLDSDCFLMDKSLTYKKILCPPDQFYSIHGILGYHDDGCVRVDENSIPRGIVNHRALRHLEIECVNSIDLFEFLESLLRCVPGLQQLQVTICPIEGFQISFHNIARLLQNYVSSLNYFHCKIPITNVYPCAIDQILHGSIHSIHLLFANVEMNNEYIIISSA